MGWSVTGPGAGPDDRSHSVRRRAVHGEAHAAVAVGSPDRGAIEVGENLRMGVPVVIAVAGADHCDRGAHSREESRGVGIAAVVRDLQDVRADALRSAQQEALGGFLRVTGQQHDPTTAGDPEHQGFVVRLTQHAVRRRVQDLHNRTAEEEAHPCRHRLDRNTLPLRGRVGLRHR